MASRQVYWVLKMSDDIPDICPNCGHDDTAFVRYEPNPNDSQTPFARHSPNIYGVTCMDCGRVHVVVVGEDSGRETTTDGYKIDKPLE